MPDPDPTNDAPPSGQFFTNWGPLEGPILGRDESPALGVLADRTAAMPIGIAYPSDLVEQRRGRRIRSAS
jgi:hypothetical protein